MHRHLLIKSLLVVMCMPTLHASHQAQSKTQRKEKQKLTNKSPSIRFINRAPAGYSHIVEVRGGRTIYISGQISVDGEGKLVGAGDFRAQVKQVFANINARLQEVNASFKDVVKTNFYITETSDIQALRDIRNSYVNKDAPPASTLVVVKQLVSPEYLCEIEVIAVVND